MIVDIRRPKTVPEAVREKSAPGAAYLGGGTWLNARRGEDPVILISLESLGLNAISLTGGRCEIGAAATFQLIADSDGVPRAVREVVLLTASRTLRNMVTLGGELGLCPEDSALIPVLMALDAVVSIAGRKRPMTIDQFDRERPDALILAAQAAAMDRRCRVQAISRTAHGPRSLVVAVSGRAAEGAPRDIRVVVSDCSGIRVRLTALEKELEGRVLPEKRQIEEQVGSMFSPRADIHASQDYKRYIAGVLIADALQELASGEQPA